MAIILDLRQGAAPEDQLIYLKEQLERFLTDLEDRDGGVQSVQMIPGDDSLKLIVTDMTGEVTEAEIQNANNIVSIAMQYYLSTSPSEPTGSETGWQADPPTPVEGKYIWQRSVIVWADGSSASTTPVCPETAAKALTKAEQAESVANQALEDAATAKSAADDAQESATAAGQAASAAATAAATADSKAVAAGQAAAAAQQDADYAEQAALEADRAAATADGKAVLAGQAASAAQTSADAAGRAAQAAQTSAANANEYAARALGNLSTVQSVAETLNWITEHGTMTLTTDTALDPTHVYFVQDANGDYVVGSTHYSVVTEPSADDLATYYELSIDESLNNYVGTHLAVTSEGLWLLPDSGGNKVLIATGQGQTYPSAGTYIIGKVNNVDAVLASFSESGIQIGRDDESHLNLDYHSMKMYDKENDVYFHISDLRAKDGYAIVSEDFVYDDDYSKVFTVSCAISDVYDVYINDNRISDSDYRVNAADWSVTITKDLSYGDKVTVEYDTDSTFAKAFTFGTRGSNKVPSPLSASFGARNISGGMASFAEGIGTKAIGRCSHSEGYDATASGDYSHAEGYLTTASGSKSHAEGYLTTASGSKSHAEGELTKASEESSHAEGSNTIASGASSHAEGGDTTASGLCSHAESAGTTASGWGSHAEGRDTTASGDFSHTEGRDTTASGDYSHTEGRDAIASNDCSHAEGMYTEASGLYSHAEGFNTTASGGRSHAQNLYTIAAKSNQTAIGKYNIKDTETTETKQKALIIGNGTGDNARSNAFTVDWQGHVECCDFSGNLKSIVDIFYPVGSYYETSLTNAIPSGQSTPTATDLANLGATWFNPEYAWGGTWELEPEGFVHISGSGSGAYRVDGTTYGANTKRIDDANIAHGHGFTQPTVNGGATTTGGMSANANHSHNSAASGAWFLSGKGTRQSLKATSAGSGHYLATATTGWQSDTSTASASVAHTHTQVAHTHSVSGGKVTDLGTPSKRTDFNVMQASKAVYRWHRTA